MIWKLKAFGVGNSSAKAQSRQVTRRGVSSRANARDHRERFLPLVEMTTRFPLRPLRSFGVAQDMLCGRHSEIRCGSAALGLCGENFFRRNPEEPNSTGGISTQHGAKILRGMVRTANRCIHRLGDHPAGRGQVCRGALQVLPDPCGSRASIWSR